MGRSNNIYYSCNETCLGKKDKHTPGLGELVQGVVGALLCTVIRAWNKDECSHGVKLECTDFIQVFLDGATGKGGRCQ